jgi:hypothetical protein
MTLTEAKEILKKTGYNIINEDKEPFNPNLVWEEGWKGLTREEQKAAEWLIQKYTSNTINLDAVNNGKSTQIIAAILDHKDAWLDYISAEDIINMVYKYLNSLTAEEWDEL